MSEGSSKTPRAAFDLRPPLRTGGLGARTLRRCRSNGARGSCLRPRAKALPAPPQTTPGEPAAVFGEAGYNSVVGTFRPRRTHVPRPVQQVQQGDRAPDGPARDRRGAVRGAGGVAD